LSEDNSTGKLNIGKFEIPPVELTEEEEKLLAKIKRRRAAQRRYNARKKLKQQQQATELEQDAERSA